MARNFLLIVDGEASDPSAAELWKRSGFEDRLSALHKNWVMWDPRGKWEPTDALTFRGFSQLIQYAQSQEAEAVAVVEPGQIFLDVPLAREGMLSFDPSKTDYFTQWEHCRLPVGVGVRALSMRTIDRLVAAARPADWLEAVRNEPGEFKFHYDVEHRTSYEESRLETRDTPALRSLLDAAGDPPSWGMLGFLSLARQDDNPPRYQPEAEMPRVDERRMPAAYGFESPECAEFPTYVMFDIVNICNARCVHCPQSLIGDRGKRPDFLAKPGHLPMHIFRNVIDECVGQKIQFIRITADGEPLVHRQLFEMFEYAAEKGVGPVGLTTNGSLLTREKSERLIRSGVVLVDFSLDAMSQETFEVIRVGLDYEQTQRNVHDFLELREQLGADVKVIVSFVRQDENEHEVEAFTDYWTPKVDKVLVRRMISNVGLTDLEEDEFPGWDSRWPCAHFFRRVVVNHEGVLKACPIDWEQKTAYRPMKETTVRDAWHSDHYWRERMAHLNDHIPEDSACKNCKDWAGTPWNMGYEKVVVELG